MRFRKRLSFNSIVVSCDNILNLWLRNIRGEKGGVYARIKE